MIKLRKEVIRKIIEDNYDKYFTYDIIESLTNLFYEAEYFEIRIKEVCSLLAKSMEFN